MTSIAVLQAEVRRELVLDRLGGSHGVREPGHGASGMWSGYERLRSNAVVGEDRVRRPARCTRTRPDRPHAPGTMHGVTWARDEASPPDNADPGERNAVERTGDGAAHPGAPAKAGPGLEGEERGGHAGRCGVTVSSGSVAISSSPRPGASMPSTVAEVRASVRVAGSGAPRTGEAAPRGQQGELGRGASDPAAGRLFRGRDA